MEYEMKPYPLNPNIMVDELGRVKVYPDNGAKRRVKGFNKISLGPNGYGVVGYSENGKRKTIGVHRLVAITFIPNPENKPEVNHKDGVKLNNVVSNLEWVTASENSKHAVRIGTKNARCDKHPCSILKDQEVIEIVGMWVDGWDYSDIAKRYAVSRSVIHSICSGRSWSHLTGLPNSKECYVI